MNRWSIKALLACGFALGVLGLTGVADDEKSTPKPMPEKAPDWSKYAPVTQVVGEVMEADENGLTLRLTQLVPNLSRGRGRGGARPKQVHEDHVLKYADEALVRWKQPPPKFDADGKKARHTSKEMAELRKPSGVPGYYAERTDLQQTHIAEVHLVRPKSIPAAKATPDDYLVKYVFILGETLTPTRPAKK